MLEIFSFTIFTLLEKHLGKKLILFETQEIVLLIFFTCDKYNKESKTQFPVHLKNNFLIWVCVNVCNLASLSFLCKNHVYHRERIYG